MSTGSIIENNRMQAVLLPFETRFPSNVKNAVVRVRGNERILTPTGCEWDSFSMQPQASRMTSLLSVVRNFSRSESRSDGA
jgi:antitoxin VapB